jgi:hypothetical protein
MDTHNSALLTGEMGPGEYIYIYLAAYAGHCGKNIRAPGV